MMEGLHGMINLQASFSKISALYCFFASRSITVKRETWGGIYSPFLF